MDDLVAKEVEWVDPDRFTLNTRDRNINQVNNAIDISTINVYQFMNEAYSGTGGFRDGRYLVPFGLEMDYESRRKLSYYENYLKPILRAMSDPVFSEYAQRSITDDAGNTLTDRYINGFIEDCTGSGMTLQDFIHKSTKLVLRHGITFVIVDNFADLPASYDEAYNKRIYPYIYVKQAYEMYSYKTDKLGSLDEITFYDEVVKSARGNKDIQRYRKWDKVGSYLIELSDKGVEKVIEEQIHNLGIVPVAISFADIEEQSYQPDPPLYDIARQNWVNFNQCIEIRDHERSCGFSIFFCQGVDLQDIALGTKNGISVPNDATFAPGFASPDSQIYKNLMEAKEGTVKNIYRLAEQSGVVGVQEATSGAAKAFDFAAHEERLRRTARMAEKLEYDIVEIFKLYTNEEFVYTSTYKSDYAPLGVDREIDRIDKVLKMPDLNSEFKRAVHEKLARMFLADEDVTVIEEIIKSIKEQKEEVAPSIAPVVDTTSVVPEVQTV